LKRKGKGKSHENQAKEKSKIEKKGSESFFQENDQDKYKQAQDGIFWIREKKKGKKHRDS